MVTVMTTSIQLSDMEERELCEVTRKTDVAAAVRTAVSEHIRFVRRQQLMDLAGKIEMTEAWRDMDAAELREPQAEGQA